MTTTAAPRSSAGTTGATTTTTDPGRTGGRRSPWLPATEVALAVLTLAVVAGFSRVFVDTSFAFSLAAVAVYTHGVSALSRRRGLGVGSTALVAALGLLVLLTVLFFADTAIAGVIPTPDTLSAAQHALSQSWSTFQNVVAPAPVETGFLLASAGAIFFAAFLADWAAFRLWSPLEAVIPASTLFVFCSLLGSDTNQVLATGLFVGALFGFLLLHRAAKQESAAGWLAADAAVGSRALVTGGTILAVAALALSLALGPHLPGATSPAIISVREANTGAGSRVTISPLVDIQRRLVDQADVEVFTVDSNERSYWRLTALDTFEGDIWRSGGKYAAVDGDLDASVPPGVSEVEAQQTFRIEALSALWLPAAFQPRSIESPDAEVRYQPESSTLIIDTSRDTSNNITYRVSSSLPRFSADQLRGASTDIPADIRTRYLQLPSDFSTLASRTAKDVTEGATTPYDKARSLQDYFQSGEFVYDLTVPPGHGEGAIDQFLQDKRGYCEQFAGTYAAMARSIGLPARVAVGFSPGDVDSSNPNRYRVRGEHAHAWPEVWLGQYGWVPFEPTPGRGAPGAEAWTGLPEQQDTSGPSTSPTTVEAPETTTPAPSTTLDDSSPTTAAPKVETQETAGGPELPGDERTPVWQLAAGTLLALVVLGGLYVGLVLLVKQRRTHHRRVRAQAPEDVVRVAWAESVEHLEVLGTRPFPAETHEEFARRAGRQLPTSGAALLDLAHDTDAAVYAPGHLGDDVAARATSASSAVADEVRSLATTAQQVLVSLDPRPVLPRSVLAGRHRAESSRD